MGVFDKTNRYFIFELNTPVSTSGLGYMIWGFIRKQGYTYLLTLMYDPENTSKKAGPFLWMLSFSGDKFAFQSSETRLVFNEKDESAQHFQKICDSEIAQSDEFKAKYRLQ